MLAELDPLKPITAIPVFRWHVGSHMVVISNHAIMMLTATVILLLVVPLALRSPRLVPRGLQNLIESICVFLREEMVRPTLGPQTDTYIGFIWTLFFFILTLNLIAMIPTERIVHLVTGHRYPFGGPATANIYITGALAVVAFVMSQVYGIRQHGFIGYLVHLAPPAPKWLLPFLYPMELVSTFIRPFTLAIRLFANIVAGHMVLATILGMIFIFNRAAVAAASVTASVALSFLELLVAFVQAYIFAFLTTLYIGMAISTEH